MYFLEQIRRQFIVTVTLGVGGPDAAINQVREQQVEKDEAVGPRGPDDVIRMAQEAEDMGERAGSLADEGRRALELSDVTPSPHVEGGAGESKILGQESADGLISASPEGGEESLFEDVEGAKTDTELLEGLVTNEPFKSIPEEEMSEILASIDIESLEVPEGMTREDALEAALNEAIEKEVTGYDERIDTILNDEAINLTEDQRAALSEYLNGIEEPTIEDIHNFLQENDIGSMIPGDNLSTPEDESLLPVPRTNLRSSGSEYNNLPSNGGSWSGENPYTGEAFEGNAGLNQEIYNVQRLKQELPADRLRHAERLEQQLVDGMPASGDKDNWLGALYRNASNNEDFSSNQPVLLHNLSTATALVMINGSVTICEATHGKGVGNANGMHGTPIGSFQMYGMTNGKYQARMGVNGLEPMRQNVSNDSTENMYDQDPASMGNANSDNRLIRVHESRGSQTQGCTGLPTEVAKQLADATRASRIGIMERFVSNPVV